MYYSRPLLRKSMESGNRGHCDEQAASLVHVSLQRSIRDHHTISGKTKHFYWVCNLHIGRQCNFYKSNILLGSCNRSFIAKFSSKINKQFERAIREQYCLREQCLMVYTHCPEWGQGPAQGTELVQ